MTRPVVQTLASLLAVVATLCAISCAHAQAPEAGASDQVMADYMLGCASSQVSMIMTLKRDGKPVDRLYATAGFFKAAGQAYSSPEYAQRRYDALRQAAQQKEVDALGADDSGRAERAQSLAGGIFSDVAACVAYQRANATTLGEKARSALTR